MNEEEKDIITSEDYTDLLIEYNRNEALLNRYNDSVIHKINTRYAVAYVAKSILDNTFVQKFGYTPLPRCYGLTDAKSIEASGITKLRKLPTFDLRGSGIIICIIDTGIDYTNPIFQKADGTTKITALWDQTIPSDTQYPKDIFYGTVYRSEQINQAIRSENPASIVPSTDDIGHGTMLAGIAAGSEVLEESFSGVAPDAELIVIKLKQAKASLMNFFKIPANIPCYQETDILWALKFILDEVASLKRPVVICIGLGTSQGALDGTGPLASTLSLWADIPETIVITAVGNEGNKRRHFFDELSPNQAFSEVELVVGNGDTGFTTELWGNLPNTYSIEVISPSGESSGRIIEFINVNREIDFIFQNTIIYVNYLLVATHAGEQLILIRFQNASEGIWRFRVYTRGDSKGSFNMWLPMNGFISDKTYFLNSNPYTTITNPSDSILPLAVTAYNPQNGELFIEASKGYTRTNFIKPELAAPGVNLVVPKLDGGFGFASGTSIAAAHTAGIAALLFEWGIIKGYYPRLDSLDIKKFLIRGATRDPSITYPNREWGYGKIEVYEVFNVLRNFFRTM